MANEYKVTVSSGTTVISAADVMNDVTLIKGVANYGDQMNVSNGGSACDTVMSSGGRMNVWSGAVVSGLTIHSGAIAFVQNGGIARNVVTDGIEYNGGRLYVSSGGYAEDVTIGELGHSNDGSLYIFAGGTVRNLSFAGYACTICGTIYNMISNTGRYFIVKAGALIDGGTATAVYFDITNATVRNVTVSSPNFVLKGDNALLENVTVTGGTLSVRGGRSEDLTVSGGTVNVSGGTAVSGTTMLGGTMNVSNGGAACDTTMTGGTLNLLSGGVASDVTLDGTAKLAILASGGVVSGNLVIKNTTAINLNDANKPLLMGDGAKIIFDLRGKETLTPATAMIAGEGGRLKKENGSAFTSYAITGDDTIGAGVQFLMTNGLGSSVELVTDEGSYTLSKGAANRISVGKNTYTLYQLAYWNYLWVENPYTLWGKITSFKTWDPANNTFIAPVAGSQTGTDETVTVGSGLTYVSMTVSSGATAAGAVISSGGLAAIGSGGTLTAATVSSAGRLTMNGGTVGTVTVLGNGTAQVLSGAALNGGTVANGGSLEMNGARAENGFTMETGAAVTITNGYASGIMMSGGTLDMMTGAVVSGATMSGGTANVSNGGIAYDAAVSSGALLKVSNGGSLSGASVGAYGRLAIASGGYAENVTYVQNNDYWTADALYVAAGAVVNNLTFRGTLGKIYGTVYNFRQDHGRYIWIYDGGVISGGSMYYTDFTHEGGLVRDFELVSGQYAARGGEIENMTLRGGTFNVTNPDENAIRGLVVSGGATANVSSGATIKEALTYGGTVNVLSGATMADTVMSGGTLSLASGGVADGLELNGTAKLQMATSGSIVRGDLVLKTTGGVNFGGTGTTRLLMGDNARIIFDLRGKDALSATAAMIGGEAHGLRLESDPDQYFSGNYVVKVDGDITAGSQYLADWGMFGNVTMWVSETETYQFTIPEQSTYQGSAVSVGGNTYWLCKPTKYKNYLCVTNPYTLWSTIAAAGNTDLPVTGNQTGTAETVTVGKGLTYVSMTVSSGATVAGAVISSGGAAAIGNGGTLTAATVSSAGLLTMNGGTVTAATVAGGTVNVAGNAVVNEAAVNGGTVNVSNGAVVNAAAVNGGTVNASNGAAVKNTVMSGGNLYVSNGAVVSGLTIHSGGAAYVCDGGAVSGVITDGINSNGGILKISSGGYAEDVVIGQQGHWNDGSFVVSAGGTARNVSCAGNAATIYGTIYNLTATGNYFIVKAGGLIDGGTVTASRFNITDATIRNVEASSYEFVLNGANALLQNVTITGNSLYLRGGLAEDLTVDNGAVYVSGTAVISGAAMNGGTMNVSSGGTVCDLTLNGGTMNVSSSGIIRDLTVSGGTMNVSNGAVISGAAMNGGTMNVSSSGIIRDLTVSGGMMNVFSGAVVSGATLEIGSAAKFNAGCSVSDLTLAAGDGYQTEFIASELTNAELNHILTVRSSANGSVKVRGTITISARFWMDSNVTTKNAIDAAGATFVFDLSRRNTDSTLINKLDCVIGASYVIQVGSDLAAGEYVLAGQANTFTDAITVKSGDTVRGTITVGNTLVSGDNFYTLAVKADNKMYFTAASSLVKDLAVTVDSGSTVVSWDAVTGATYQVSEDGGSSWESVSGSSYTYTGVETKDIQVRMADTQGNYGTVSKITVAGAAESTAAADAVSSAGENATITLREGTYSSGGAITMMEGQTLVGQVVSGTELATTVANAIYGAGNAVVVKELTALKNVVGGAANAAATSTELTVSSATLKDAFAGVLVNNGSYNVGTMAASLSGTYFRNLYGAGYVTGTDHALTADAINLAISGGSSSGSTYGAGRAANSATLNVTTVNLTVDNPAINGSLGAVYAGGYANSASTLNIGTANTTITTGWFTKFVAGGSQVYGEGTSASATATNLTISGGNFDNAVLGASYAASSATATVTTATTTISGGSFSAFVAGGGFVNDGTVTVGSTNLTISGGTFTKYIFGGNLCSSKGTSTITGQAHVTLDTTENSISAAAIYAGSLSYAGVTATVGSTLLELKGDGGKLSFTHMYGSNANPKTAIGVTGTKELFFNGFTGNLAGKLYNFDTFTMTGSTVAFTKPQDLTDVSTWNLNLTSSVDDETALLDWSNGGVNAFSGDTMNLTFDTASTTDLLVIKGAEGLDLSLSEGMTVEFNGNAASYADGAWSLDGWKLSNVQTTIEESTVNNLVLSKIA